MPCPILLHSMYNYFPIKYTCLYRTQILQTSALQLLVIAASENQSAEHLFSLFLFIRLLQIPVTFNSSFLDHSSFPRNSHLLSQHSRAATTSVSLFSDILTLFEPQWNKISPFSLFFRHSLLLCCQNLANYNIGV